MAIGPIGLVGVIWTGLIVFLVIRLIIGWNDGATSLTIRIVLLLILTVLRLVRLAAIAGVGAPPPPPPSGPKISDFHWSESDTARDLAAAAAAQNQSDQSPSPQPARDPFERDGWLGTFSRPGGLLINITVLPADATTSRTLTSKLDPADRGDIVAAVSVRNATDKQVKLDTAGMALFFADGSQTFPMNANDILAAAPRIHQDGLQSFRSPYVIKPRSAFSKGILLLPPTTDFAHLDHIRLTVDAAWIDIHGTLFSATEKPQLSKAK